MINLTKKDLIAMAVKQDEIASKAFMDYQETGVTRYDTKRRNAEDLAEAFRAAANAADDHNQLQSLKGELMWMATKADNALHAGADQAQLQTLLRELIAYASLFGYKRREDDQ